MCQKKGKHWKVQGLYGLGKAATQAESLVLTCSSSFVWSLSAVHRHRMEWNAMLNRIRREVPSPQTEKNKDQLCFSVASFRKAFFYC